MNKKGFAISTMIYSILILFLGLIVAILGLLANRKLVLDKLKHNVSSSLNNEEIYVNIYKDYVLNGADPIISGDLIPVIITNTGTVLKASLYTEWYNYANKNWANAIILKDKNASYKDGEEIPFDNIESYFVWIPKYSYKIFNLGNYTSVITVDSKPSESAAQEIEIKFGTGNTKDEIDGECTTPMLSGKSGNCKVGDYMTHPAFISMDTTGLWVAKFETTGTTNSINVLPNQTILRNINVKTMFELSYNYNRSLDSHMMKNTEWGAVAYLSHSKYGINEEIRINNSATYTTGCAATVPALNYVGKLQSDHTEGYYVGCENAYNTQVGVLASTTGNISGIYDMSGGAWEYMASYRSNTLGSSGFDASSISNYDNKYFDIYLTDSETTTYNKRILGDATGELGPFFHYKENNEINYYRSTWGFDYSYYINASIPWFERGGCYDRGILAGSFAFHRETGTAYNYISFRLVLTKYQ